MAKLFYRKWKRIGDGSKDDGSVEIRAAQKISALQTHQLAVLITQPYRAIGTGLQNVCASSLLYFRLQLLGFHCRDTSQHESAWQDDSAIAANWQYDEEVAEGCLYVFRTVLPGVSGACLLFARIGRRGGGG